MDNPSKKTNRINVIAAFILLFFGVCYSYAQNLFPALAASIPAEDQGDVPREQGKKGIVYQFYFLPPGSSIPITRGIDLDLSMAIVTLQIGTNSPITCTETINPIPGNAGFQVIDTSGDEDTNGVDTNRDAVEIFYNGDFPASTVIEVKVTGATANMSDSTVVVQDDPTFSPNLLNFTTGTKPPRSLVVSLELVFDISGSMASAAVPGGSITRMDALKYSAQVIFPLLKEYSMLGDKLGLVFFSTTATTIDPTPGGSNLEMMVNDSKMDYLASKIQEQTPTRSTSIGAGLLAANQSGFAADLSPNPTKHILLFSDGEQNTEPMVDVDVSGKRVLIGGNTYPSDIVINSITAGRQAAEGFGLQSDIAEATGGAECHIRDGNGDDAENFFTEDLESFFAQITGDAIQGDKVEVVTDITGSVSQGRIRTETFLGNTNDIAHTIILSWSNPNQPDFQDFLPFQLRAPNGTTIDLSHRLTKGRNMSAATVRFPLRQSGMVINLKGSWKVELRGDEIKSLKLNYHLMVMSDNKTIASEFYIDRQATLLTGEPIPIHVKLTDDGSPVTDATVQLQPLGPEYGVGDILSETSRPSGTPDLHGDGPVSEAQAKLLLIRQSPADRDLFAYKSLRSAQLFDQGKDGDKAANDGIYTAVFNEATEEGYYHFAVTVLGNSSSNGNFQRTWKLVAFVRPALNFDNSELKVTNYQILNTGEVLTRIRADVRDRLGNHLGPGYSDLLQISASDGKPVSALEDKLDGTYERSFQLTSTKSDPQIYLEMKGSQIGSKKFSDLRASDWTGGVRVGNTVPLDRLADQLGRAVSVDLFVDRRVTDFFSLETNLGHDRFKAKGLGDDYYTTSVYEKGKLNFSAGRLQPSLHGGIGIYIAKGGDKFFGWNYGASVQFQTGFKKIAMEVSYNRRDVDSGNLTYSTLQLGVQKGF